MRWVLAECAYILLIPFIADAWKQLALFVPSCKVIESQLYDK